MLSKGKKGGRLSDLELGRFRKEWNQEEIKRIIAACAHTSSPIRNSWIITVMLWYGLRVSEVANLKFSDVNFARQTIFIKRLKGSEPTIAKIYSYEFLDFLIKTKRKQKINSEYIFTAHNYTTPLSRTTITKIIKKCGEISRVVLDSPELGPNLTAHGLKHTTVNQLLDFGVQIHKVSKKVGHKKISSTMHYVSSNLTKEEEKFLFNINPVSVFGEEEYAKKL